MADFSRPEYASYVQFCRELHIDHEPQSGDWYEIADPEPDGSVTLELVFGGPWWRFSAGFIAVWLPTLADWVEMLEDPSRGLTLTLQHDEYWLAFLGPYGISPFERGPTAEEAVARLCAGTTKIPVEIET